MPGSLTGPCIEDACLGTYVCLSELCIDPNASGTGPAGGSASDAGADSPTTASDESGPGIGSGASEGESSTGVGGSDNSEGGSDTGNCVGADCPCHAVDLLFVIDNSLSMANIQLELGHAFPAFADAMIATLPIGTSLHVGVTTTQIGYASSAVTTNCEATSARGPQEEYYSTAEDDPTDVNGAQGRLFVADGLPYFQIDTDAGATDVAALHQWFATASFLGESGSNIEMSAAAAGWATDPVNAAANAGFLRDAGAVLVLVFFQDEPDQSDAPSLSMQQTGAQMLDKIAAAKSACGGLTCVVAGGFVEESCLPINALGTLLDGLPRGSAVESMPPIELATAGAFEPLLVQTLAPAIASACNAIGPGR